jgi:hypothetical protein
MILASAARPTRSTRTDASVTIRPRIPTPAQRVSRICAGTDVLAADADPEVLGLPPVQAGRALPRAHSITCFTGFNSRIKSPKDQKTKA